MRETMLDYAALVHDSHVAADGTQGHTSKYEWRSCTHKECQDFRDSLKLPNIGRCLRDQRRLVGKRGL